MKFIAIAAVLFSMSFISCGGSKEDTEASTVDYQAIGDSLAHVLEYCNSIEEVEDFKTENKELISTLPTDIQFMLDSISYFSTTVHIID